MYSYCFAAHLSRTEDANGWTEFSPSSDSDVVYVSAVDGNNTTCDSYRPSDNAWQVSGTPFEPDSGEIIPCEDFSTAYAKTATGGPDWILFKRGETFSTTGLGNIDRSGKDGDEPFLISAYGSSGDSPVIETGTSRGMTLLSENHYIAIVGLDFYANDRNPGDGGSIQGGDHGFYCYIGDSESVTSFLIEGCKFRWFQDNINFSTHASVGEVDVEIRRNILADNYCPATYDSQGIWAKKLDNLLVEENYFIHNGWYIVSSGTGEDRSGGQATIWNHAIYMNSVDDLIIRRNVFADPSASNIKLTRQYQTTSTTIKNNLFIGGEDTVQAGNNYPTAPYDYHFANFEVQNNITTHGGRDDHTNQNDANGYKLGGLDGGGVRNNLLINVDSGATASHALAPTYSKSRNSTWENNIVYLHGLKYSLRIGSVGAGSSNMVFQNNNLQHPGVTFSGSIVLADYDIRSAWTFSGNKYFAAAEDFDANGTPEDMDGWNTWASADGVFSQHTFTANTRDVDTYMQSLGETATIDAYITACRALDRWSSSANDWDKYSSDNVNDWIRAGFDLSEYGVSEGGSIMGQGVNISGGGVSFQ